MTEERKSKEFVAIYTDGSCLGNPGPGGWAAILVCRGVEREISGGHTKTTNNRMELMAVVKALQALKRPCKVEITSDSSYVVNAIEKGWLKNWVDKNTLKDRPNNDLWAELLILLDKHDIKFKWIKGHAGHPYNERCDEMAVRMSNKAKNSLVDHYEGTYNDDIEVLEAEFASEVDALEWVANHAVKMESIVEVEYGVVLTYSRKYKYPNSRNDASNKEVKANTGISQFEKRKKQQKYEEEQMRKTEENKQWVVCTRIDNSELFITPKGTAFIESEATLFTEESARLKAKALTNNSKRGYIWGIKRVRITHR